MTVTCVVQARMGSSRFPGKVVADLHGRPMLAFLLERIASLDPVVATTDLPADDPVAEIAEASGARVVRGPELDVLERFAMAIDRFPADVVVRLTADCPLVDAALVGEAVGLRDSTGADYASNTLVRTYPDGLDVEVVATDALAAAAREARDPVEREHVTPFVYRRPERFMLRTLRRLGAPLGWQRWTVDTPDDLEFVRALVGQVGRDDFGWEEALVALPDERPPTIRLDPVGPVDERVLLELRNEPDSVRGSKSGRAVTRDEHRRWFATLLDDPRSRGWVLRDRAEVVGQVRVDVRDGTGTVSITVAPGHRGRGLGARLLDGLTHALAADAQVHTLRADVHAANDASRRLFASADFQEVGRDGDFVTMTRSTSSTT